MAATASHQERWDARSRGGDTPALVSTLIGLLGEARDGKGRGSGEASSAERADSRPRAGSPRPLTQARRVFQVSTPEEEASTNDSNGRASPDRLEEPEEAAPGEADAESAEPSKFNTRCLGQNPSVVSCALAYTKLTDLPREPCQGVRYVPFLRESALMEMQQRFSARAGDVFVVSNTPFPGLYRVLVSLVEGRDDPWATDSPDLPGGCGGDLHSLVRWCEIGASQLGCDRWQQDADLLPGRRCFKSYHHPAHLPCRYPFEARPEDGKPAPKVVVLVADPRNYLKLAWEICSGWLGLQQSFAEFLEEYMRICSSGKAGSSILSGNWIEFLAAWSEEAARNPDMVRLVSADRLGSLDPKEFASELMEVASFVGASEDAARRLTSAVFRRPTILPPPAHEPNKDKHMLYKLCEAGHLTEQSARNAHSFEDTLSQLGTWCHEQWAEVLSSARRHLLGSPKVVEAVQMASKGRLSLPPVKLTEVCKGETAHKAGLCRPCVFALRGICKNTEELCRYCHDPSHPRTKRAARSTRTARQAMRRIRTPSPAPGAGGD